MKFTISIAAHNNLELTKKCLESIRAMSEGSDYEIIVIDNASTDQTRVYLDAQPDVQSIWNAKNMGFGVAHNQALRRSRGDYLVVLNNDLTISTPGWLERMAGEFERNPKLAICGVKGACAAFDKTGLGIPTNDPPEYIEGSCLMIRTDLLDERELFAKEFEFAYCEDADLSLRMRELGYELAQADVTVVHIGAATARIVENEIDLKGYHGKNSSLLRAKWWKYFSRKDVHRLRILIKRTGAQGDVIMATAAVRAVKRQWPHARVCASSLMFQSVFDRNPYVNEHLSVFNPMEPHPFDKVFDLDMAYEREPRKHAVQAYLDVCGVPASGGLKPDLYPSDEDEAFAQKVLDGCKDKLVVIHPGMTGWVGRQWPIDNFEECAITLRGRGWQVALAGDRNTPDIAHDIDLRGCTLHQLAAVLDRTDLFLGIDSMPMHVAQSTSVKVVAVFGCVDPKYRLTGEDAVGVTADGVGCLGCHHYLPAPRTATIDCWRGRQLCLEKLTVEKVISYCF